jgi:hypothetical protein
VLVRVRVRVLAILAVAIIGAGCGVSSNGASSDQVNSAMRDFNSSIGAYLSIRGPGSTTDAASWQAWETVAGAKVDDMAARFAAWSNALDRYGKASNSMVQYRDAMGKEVKDQVEQARLAKNCLATGMTQTAAQCFASMLSTNYQRWAADAAAVNAYLRNPPQGAQAGSG